MKHIDESRLESDIAYRFDYLADFIGFRAEDAAAVQACAPYLGPIIPEIVEKTYEKLLAFDATARHFVPRQSGFDGPVPDNLQAISAGHPQIQFRKEHLARYFMQILGRTCDAKLSPYLDMVGKIHTPQAGNAQIDVPLVQMNALMGFMSDVLVEILSNLPFDTPTLLQTVRAFNKLLWIQ
ncbi:MAG: protoglobin family protein, partial [Planctomycetes bacterium]|nr:protoglobin family protein [Planctomycetota bacterium]